jgi:mannosidase alpha-like ER degradation enhancer 2
MSLCLVLAGLVSTHKHPSVARIQDSTTAPIPHSRWAQLAEQVKDEFVHSWDAYVQFAEGYDELKPISRRGNNRNGGHSLLWTPIDALDTMLLMQLTDQSRWTTNLICKDMKLFDIDAEVAVFDAIIRILGGLLSAYALSAETCLLKLATDLGQRLLPAFNTQSGIPAGNINLRTGTTNSGPEICPAGGASNVIEMQTLSHMTGDPRFAQAGKRALKAVFNSRDKSSGLVSNCVDTGSRVAYITFDHRVFEL